MNRRFLATAVAAALAGLGSTPAWAHFSLVAPEAYSQQDGLGSPQKSAPCGQADPGDTAVPTGIVTEYEEGSIITITVNETIYHPGHYRVQIAQDQAGIPADPPVTAGGTACGSTIIEAAPTMPLLADGALLHNAPFGGQQSFQVQLPPGFTCTNCVLQIAEFMSNHGLNNPGGCFYHHCATVSIVAAGVLPDAGPMVDGGGAGGVDAAPGSEIDGGGNNEVGEAPGCGCRTAPRRSPGGAGALLGVMLVGLLVLRRRRA